MSNQKLAHFGVGKAGRLWITYLSDIVDVSDMIDPDPRSTSFANRHGAEFYRTVPQGSADGLLPPLNSTDIPQRHIWTITSPLYQRGDIVTAGLAYQVPIIYTQRPLARTVDEIEKIQELAHSYNGKLSVNYKKNNSSVIGAVLNDISDGFTLTEAIHVSNKETNNIKPLIRSKFVDEFALLQRVYKQTNSQFDPAVENVSIEKWNQTESFESSQLRDVYDCKASVKLSDHSDAEIKIEGEFGDEEREQLLWADFNNESAYFVSFSDTDNLTPTAVKFSNLNDLSEVKSRLSNGDLSDNESIDRLVKESSGTKMHVDSKENQLKNIFKDVCNGEIEPASLDDAATVEKLAKEAYVKGGEESMYTKESELIESGESVW